MNRGTVGIILAGGRSRRMGTDKALLEIDGETLLARTTRVVATVVPEVLIVGRTSLPPELTGTPAVLDAYGEAGPLGGIATGLAHSGAERVLVVACDLPYLQVEVLRFLVSPAFGYDAVVPILSDRAEEARSSGGAMRHMGEQTTIKRGAGGQARGPAPTTGTTGTDPTVTEVTGSRPARHQGHEAPSVHARPHPTCAVYGQSCLPVMLSFLEQGRYRLRELLDALNVRWVQDEEIRRVDPAVRSFLNANTPEDWRELTRGD